MKTLITTVGVSLLDNYISSPYHKRYPINQEVELFSKKSVSERDLYLDEYKCVYNNLEDDYFTKLIKKNDAWHPKEGINIWASAEIFSIIHFYERNKKDELKIHLIASDTLTSYLSAELIKKFFNLQKVKEEYPNITIEKIEYIPNLKTINITEEEIEDSFFKLIEKIIELKKGQNNVILNITGGYKGFIPILSIIGQLEKLPLYYIYEKSEHGIVVSPFPLAIDWTYAELYGVLLKNTHLLAQEEYSEIKQELEDLHLITQDNQLTLFGKLFKRYTDKYHAGERGVMFGHIMEFFFFKFVRNSLEIKDITQSFKPEEDLEVDLYSKEFGFWAEVKSFAGLKKASEQVKRYYNYAKTNDLLLKKLVIFLYKFEFENINDYFRILKDLDVWTRTENINFEIYLYNLPFNTKQGKKGKININEILKTDFDKVSNSELTINKITNIKFYKIEIQKK